jgi:hypothetical protein
MNSKIPRACLQNNFMPDFDLILAETRREEGAYWAKSVTDEQQRLNENRPKDGMKVF